MMPPSEPSAGLHPMAVPPLASATQSSWALVNFVLGLVVASAAGSMLGWTVLVAVLHGVSGWIVAYTAVLAGLAAVGLPLAVRARHWARDRVRAARNANLVATLTLGVAGLGVTLGFLAILVLVLLTIVISSVELPPY